MNHFLQMMGGLFLGQMIADHRAHEEREAWFAQNPWHEVIEQEPVEPVPTREQIDEAVRRLDAGEFISRHDVIFMGKHVGQGDYFGHLSTRQILKVQQRLAATMLDQSSDRPWA